MLNKKIRIRIPKIEYNLSSRALWKFNVLIRLSELFSARLGELSLLIGDSYSNEFYFDQIVDHLLIELDRVFTGKFDCEEETLEELLACINNLIEKYNRDGHDELADFFRNVSVTIRDDTKPAEEYILLNNNRGAILANSFIYEAGKNWDCNGVEKVVLETATTEFDGLASYGGHEKIIVFRFRNVLGIRSLYDFFIMPFVFFHEYLSHVMPPAKYLPRTFTDGWLLWYQNDFYRKMCDINEDINVKGDTLLELQQFSEDKRFSDCEIPNQKENYFYIKKFCKAARDVHSRIRCHDNKEVYTKKLLLLTSDLMEINKDHENHRDFHSYFIGQILEPVDPFNEDKFNELLSDLRDYENIQSFLKKITKKREPFFK